MKTRFYSPSVNILRDQFEEISYFPTINGESSFNKIIQSYDKGIRSFCIIGAYGTGKSAFLLALSNVLSKKAQYFKYSKTSKTFIPHFVIGDFESLETRLKKTFLIQPKEDFFDAFERIITNHNAKDEILILVLDEFGKFLEYSAAVASEKEMYFIQKLSEFVNSPKHKILLITTLHQPFEDYAIDLPYSQRKEWTKVSGRLIQIPFNEPVEQMLFLASEHIVNKGFKLKVEKNKFDELFSSIIETDAFPLNNYFNKELAVKLYPFDLLSSSVITLAFQFYGQNERSLFNFLNSDEYYGLSDFSYKTQFYSLADVYDYLSYNFHTVLNSKHNPHALQWRAIRDALEIVDNRFDQEKESAGKIVKSIGLLNIFGKSGIKIDLKFLSKYSDISLQNRNSTEIIQKLENLQIIRFQKYNQKFVLFKGTDFSINQALEEAENAVTNDFNIISKLQSYFSFPVFQAKKEFYEKGTPRYFIFELTENHLKKDPEGPIDGYINLVIHDLLDEKKLKEFSKNIDKAVLYGWLSNSDRIREILYEIEKINWVKEQAKDDFVVQAELESNKKSLKERLNNEFALSLYGNNANIWWFYKGERVFFKNQRDLNKYLSKICSSQYPFTPVFKNESINKHKVQGAITSARRTLINGLLNHSNLENLGFDNDLYPPERTIYNSLIKATGIHRFEGKNWELGRPKDSSFLELWNFGEKFLNECAVSPRKLSDFISKLSERPFKLKQGFIDIWVPLFLITKKSEFAFYEDGLFIPDLTDDTIDVAMRQAHKYFIHTFYLSEQKLAIFNQYRYFLNQIEEESPSKDSFIETIKPFLTFYKRLTTYSQDTKSISIYGVRLRDAIANSSNPERAFFEEIPRALGYSFSDLCKKDIIENFAIKLRDTIREISSTQESLFNKIESIINGELPDSNLQFPYNKELLQKRYLHIRKDELNIKQKVFYQRISTALEDRKSWINSIAIAVVNKSLENFNDKDVDLFAIKLPNFIHELDNLTELSKEKINKEKEVVLKLEITSFLKGVQKNLVRLPKTKSGELLLLEEQIRPFLLKEKKQENIALLIKLLQEQIENED